MTLSTAGSSATFTTAAGVAANSTNADMMTLPSSISKTTAAWAVGTGVGALDTGTIANSTWYHVHLIKRTDTQVVDVLISLSATAPVLPAPYTEFRRIGSMLTNASGQWTMFHQLGDEFLWDIWIRDVNGATVTTANRTLFTLTVPTGVQVFAMSTFFFPGAGTQIWILVTSPDVSDNVPSAADFDASIATGSNDRYYGPSRTNTSAQAGVRASAAGAIVNVITRGWFDRRGRDN